MDALKKSLIFAAAVVAAALLAEGRPFAEMSRLCASSLDGEQDTVAATSAQQVEKKEGKFERRISLTGWIVIETGWKLKGDKTDSKTFQCSDLPVTASYSRQDGQKVTVKGGVGFTPIANRCHFTIKNLPAERNVSLQVLRPDWLKNNCDQWTFVAETLNLKTAKKEMLNVELIVKEIACHKVK